MSRIGLTRRKWWTTLATPGRQDPECVDSFHPRTSMWRILRLSHPPKSRLHPKTSIPRRVWNHTSFGTALRSMISMYKLACSAALRPCQPAKIEISFCFVETGQVPWGTYSCLPLTIAPQINGFNQNLEEIMEKNENIYIYGNVSPTLRFFHIFLFLFPLIPGNSKFLLAC